MKNFKPEAWMLPQPVLIIGTYNADGTPNAMNSAWCGQWDYHEIFISLGSHATTANIKRCPDFTMAFATVDTHVAADYVGLVSAKSCHDKMEHTGWNAVKAANVDAPVFDCFPMTMECRVKELLNESESGCYVIAEIVNIVCDKAFLAEDGKPDLAKMRLITFDPTHNGYNVIGERIGNAFHDGLALKQ